MAGRRIIPLLVILLLIVAGTVGFFGYRFYQNYKMKGSRSAVFMTNGQVYFGYISDTAKTTVKLRDVYYLKTGDLQNSSDKKIMLVKMGNELHSPENSMSINRDQILFWQYIKDNSQINEAIKKFTQNNASPTPSPAPSK